jgi:hypothetical protein
MCMKKLIGCLSVLISSLFTACPSAPPTISVSPSVSSVTAGASMISFAAALTNSNAEIRWSLSPNLGLLTSTTGAVVGYSPPSAVTSLTSVIVTASAAGVSASATVSVNPALSVSPVTAAVTAGGSATSFTASGAGATVNWSLSPNLGALNTSAGTTVSYTPPSTVTAATTVVLSAVSSGQTATVTITVNPSGVTSSLSVSPDNASVNAGSTPVSFAASLVNVGGPVNWSLDPNVGTLSATTGPSVTYTPPATVTTDTSITLTATAGALTSSATINVNAVSSVPGTLRGSLRDAQTNEAIAGVSVQVSNAAGSVGTVLSDAAGLYNITVPSGSGYGLAFSKAGYQTATVRNVTVFQNEAVTVDRVLFISSSVTGTGAVSGMVTNAFTGAALVGAQVVVRSGLGTQGGAALQTTFTNGSGAYNVAGLNTGYYTAEVSFSGFVTGFFNVVSLGGVNTANQNFSITPVVADNAIRIVLTWGATPFDLDSHLTGPNGINRFHVYFSAKSFTNTTVTANLDVDDVSSYGPETVTLTNASTGLFRYSVHDYSNASTTTSSALSNSNARVRVFRGGGAVPVLDEFVPVGFYGNLWTVFELDDGVVRRVNTISNVSGSSFVSRAGTLSRTDAELLRFLPTK